MKHLSKKLLSLPWIWSVLASAVLLFIVMSQISGGSIGAVITTTLEFSIFFMLVGMGQMLVIATGPGNIDLSIPANMTLSGYLSMIAMGQSDGGIVLGILVAIACGATIGIVNTLAIRILKIPPIIATMALSYIQMSLAFSIGGESRVAPPDAFAAFTHYKIGWVPVQSLIFVVISILVAIMLTRTNFGRSIMAVGQNERAAYLTRIPVQKIRAGVYVICGIFAALAGVSLAGFSGGASLNMGEEYLLVSVAIVVLGGCSITGGKANTIGIWGASLFMFLLATMSNTMGMGQGARLVISGLIIIFVTIFATNKETAG